MTHTKNCEEAHRRLEPHRRWIFSKQRITISETKEGFIGRFADKELIDIDMDRRCAIIEDRICPLYELTGKRKAPNKFNIHLDGERADFTGWDLSGCRMAGVALNRVVFTNATLKRVVFNESIMQAAELKGADLTDAFLIKCYLHNIKCENTNFTNASLYMAKSDIFETYEEDLPSPVTHTGRGKLQYRGNVFFFYDYNKENITSDDINVQETESFTVEKLLEKHKITGEDFEALANVANITKEKDKSSHFENHGVIV